MVLSNVDEYVCAGELRYLGVPVDPSIPDVAVIPRMHVRIVRDPLPDGSGERVTVAFDSRFLWEELVLTGKEEIEKEEER